MVTSYTKVNTKNVTRLYNKTNGNLYFRDTRTGKNYQVVEDFMLDELKYALKLGQVEMIWIEGPSLGTDVEVEDM
jgi:hypothetical protein